MFVYVLADAEHERDWDHLQVSLDMEQRENCPGRSVGLKYAQRKQPLLHARVHELYNTLGKCQGSLCIRNILLIWYYHSYCTCICSRDEEKLKANYMYMGTNTGIVITYCLREDLIR